jgi:hypothetical protein
MERTVDHSDATGGLSIALDSRDTRAVEHLLAHCAILSAAQEPEPRRPVFERLRELLGGDLTSLLLFGLTRAQRPRLPLEDRGASAP